MKKSYWERTSGLGPLPLSPVEAIQKSTCGFYFKIPLLILALAVTVGCFGGASPTSFVNPIESRLILQVPFFSDEAGLCAPAALASVMTYGGRPTTTAQAAAALDQEKPSIQSMAVWARREGLKADVFSGSPEQLLDAVKTNRPIIVRLDLDSPPVKKGHYAVIVGYSPLGPVVNSCAINQQIITWKDFLAGWYRSKNITLMVEPL